MKVLAAVAHENQKRFALEELDLTGPGPEEILVRIVGVGLCHTDVKALAGGMGVAKPIVLGHEGAGIVEKVGAGVRKVKPGDHVVLTYDSCGVCAACNGGNPAYCMHTGDLNFRDHAPRATGQFRQTTGAEIHGHFFGQSSFASYAIARERNTIPVRKDAPLEILGVLGCGVQTGAGAIINSFAAKPGDAVAIFGVGPVGLSAIMAAVMCGCSEIVAIDVFEPRLTIAKDLGATKTVLANPQTKPSDEVRRLIPGGVNFVLDTTGIAQSYQQAIASLATKGTFGFVTVPAGGFKLNLGQLMLGGLNIRGIVQGDSVPDKFIPHLIDLYLAGRFPFDRLITKYPFREINEAAEDQAAGRTVKPVFTFSV
jgi:aryl-alcohol dehydrogenase